MPRAPSKKQLVLVGSEDEVGSPTFSLSDTPVWLTVSGRPGHRSRIAFNTGFLPVPRHTSAAILVRIPGDASVDRNEWGLYNPDFGRFFWLPHSKDGEMAALNLRWPSETTIKLGFVSNNHRGEALISAEILVEEDSGAFSGRVYMSAAETRLFEDRLGSVRSYLEFGCGGSTISALKAGVERIVSVEADAVWIKGLKCQPAIAEAVAAGRLVFVHADIGPVGSWSLPVSREPAAQWSEYYLAPWRFWDEPPDIVLVDGRFRAACAILALLGCPDTPVMIHDFVIGDDRRESYMRVLEIADRIDGVDNLIVLKRKQPFDALRAIALLADVRHEFR